MNEIIKPKRIKYTERIGTRIGRLTVIELLKESDGSISFSFVCDCGNTGKRRIQQISTKRMSSCGCYKMERAFKLNSTHNKSKSPEYGAWQNIKHRCLNKRSKAYSQYGGRGIKICERWIGSFENFISDMGERGEKDLSIERINVNGDYEPENCKWATTKEQARNKTNSRKFKVFGNDYFLDDLAIEFNVHPGSFRNRIKNGETNEQAVINYLRRWK